MNKLEKFILTILAVLLVSAQPVCGQSKKRDKSVQ